MNLKLQFMEWLCFLQWYAIRNRHSSILQNLTLHYVGFQVPRVAGMKTTTFWDIAQCSLAEVDRHFRGVCCLHRQDDDSSRQHASLKRLSTTTRLHSVIFHNAVIFLPYIVQWTLLQLILSDSTHCNQMLRKWYFICPIPIQNQLYNRGTYNFCNWCYVICVWS